MRVVGLTGGIASGKSTVARLFRQQGLATLSADAIVSDLYRPASPVLKKIGRLLGPEYLERRGRLRRAAVARAVFAHLQLRRKLERIVHPAVTAEINRRVKALRGKGCGVAIAEVPLLFEAGMARDFDWIVVVRAPLAVRVWRVINRHRLSRADALRRIRAQWPLSRKLKQADYRIDGYGPISRTRSQVVSVVQDLVRAAGHDRDLRGRGPGRRRAAAAGRSPLRSRRSRAR